MATQDEIAATVRAVKGAANALGCVPNFSTSQAGQDQLTTLAALVSTLQTLTAP